MMVILIAKIKVMKLNVKIVLNMEGTDVEWMALMCVFKSGNFVMV